MNALSPFLVLAALAAGAALGSARENAPYAGEIEVTAGFLTPPNSLVLLKPVPSIMPVWNFDDLTEAEVRELLREIEMPAGLREALLDDSVWWSTGPGTILHPVPATVLELPEPSRVAIYEVLAGYESNPYHHEPFLFGADVRGWFRDALIHPKILDQIENLSYPRGKVRAFSDLPMILAMLTREDQEHGLMRAIYGTPTLSVKVRLDSMDKLPSFLSYWTLDHRFDSAEPLVRALARTGQPFEVDLFDLLPSIPRKRLYSWPSLSAGMSGTFPDGFSTALRFFQTNFGDAAIDSEIAAGLIETHYRPVEPPYRFGDLIVLGGGDEEPLHVCTWIAEGIVFTKLSRSVLNPWSLHRLDDIRPFFEREDNPLTIQGWRLREGKLNMPPVLSESDS